VLDARVKPGNDKGDEPITLSSPPTVILDVDETILDNSPYQVWMVKSEVFLMAKKQPDWGSAKGTRRAYVDYRILLNFGDSFGDFVDNYRTGEAERLKTFEENRERWGREWIMLANPSYGSFEVAPFTQDPKLPLDQQRKAKREALQGRSGE